MARASWSREAEDRGRRRLAAALAFAAVAVLTTSGASAQVLRVGRYKGVAGQFNSIQAALDAARPGDWVPDRPG